MAQVRINGKRVSLRVPFADKRAHSEALKQALSSAQPAPPPAHTLTAAFDEALRLHYRGELAKNQQVPAKVAEMLEFFGPTCALQSITSKHIAEFKAWLEQRKNTGKTINRKLAVLSKTLHLAVEWGWLGGVPKIRREGETHGRLVWIVSEQETAILKWMANYDSRWADACVVMLDTGMRPSELRRFVPRDVSAGGVSVWKAKGKKPRTVPLTKRAGEALTRHEAFEWMTEDRLVKVWDSMRKATGVSTDPLFTAYAMRHTFAVRHLEAGTDLLTLAELMGHSKLETTRIYAHVTGKLKREAIERVESVSRGVSLPPDREPVEPRRVGSGTGVAGINSPSLYRLSYQGIASKSTGYAQPLAPCVISVSPIVPQHGGVPHPVAGKGNGK